jgi:hypothetical protein
VTNDFALDGQDGAYVPCDELAADLDADEEGAIYGLASGYVAQNVEADPPAAPERAAIVGSAVGFVPKLCCCIDPFTRTIAGVWGRPPVCFDPWDHYYCVITPTDEWRVLDDFERLRTGEWDQPTGTHASFGTLSDWAIGATFTPVGPTLDIEVASGAGVIGWTLESGEGQEKQVNGDANITVPRASLGGLSPTNRDIVRIQFVFQFHSDFVHSYDPPGAPPIIYNEQRIFLRVGYSDNVSLNLLELIIDENYDPLDGSGAPRTIASVTGSGLVELPFLDPDVDHTVLLEYIENTSGRVVLDDVEVGSWSNAFTLPSGDLRVVTEWLLNVSSDPAGAEVNEGSITIRDIQTFVTTYPCVDTPPVGLSVDGDEGVMAGPLTEIGGLLISRLNLTDDGATAVELPLDVIYTFLFTDYDGRTLSFVLGDVFDAELGSLPVHLRINWSEFFHSLSLDVGNVVVDSLNINEPPELDVPYKVRLRLNADQTGHMKFWLASEDEPCLWAMGGGPPVTVNGGVDGSVGAIGVFMDLPRSENGDTVGSTIRLDAVKVCIGPSAGDGGLFDGGALADDKDDAPVLTDPPAGVTTYSVDTHTQTEDATDPSEFASRGDNTSWLKIVLTDEMDLRFDTVGSSYDTYLYVYDGASPPGTGATSIYSDDDDGPGNTSAIPSMTAFVTLAAGTYWLVVLPFSTGSVGSPPDTSVIRVSRECD